jgi:hypothetical protein
VESTFLNRNRQVSSPAAKWKHQALLLLIGHMIVFIMAP